MGRNITITLDEDIIRSAKVLAAKRGSSVSALLRTELERLVLADRAYEAAREVALRRLRRGSHLGGGTLPSRQELHDREDLR